MKILVFSVEKYEKDYLDKLTEVQLHELALSDDNDTFLYDNVYSFIDNLNNEFINIDNSWVYAVNID